MAVTFISANETSCSANRFPMHDLDPNPNGRVANGWLCSWSSPLSHRSGTNLLASLKYFSCLCIKSLCIPTNVWNIKLMPFRQYDDALTVMNVKMIVAASCFWRLHVLLKLCYYSDTKTWTNTEIVHERMPLTIQFSHLPITGNNNQCINLVTVWYGLDTQILEISGETRKYHHKLIYNYKYRTCVEIHLIL